MIIKYKEAILYLIVALLILGIAVAKTYPQITNLYSIENNITSTSAKVADLQRKLDELQKADNEKKAWASVQSKKIYKPEGANLDAENCFAIIFDDIIDMAKYNGIKVYSIEYNYNPAEDEFIKNAAGQYNVCQLNMSIISDYQDLESFLKDLFKYPYLINIQKIETMPYPKNKKILLTTLQIKLYTQRAEGQVDTSTPAPTANTAPSNNTATAPPSPPPAPGQPAAH